MLLDIGEYPFVFVPLAQARPSTGAGLYAVICVRNDQTRTIIDVGQTSRLGQQSASLIPQECWTRNCADGELWIGHHWPDTTSGLVDLAAMETQIRASVKPPCG